MTTQRPAARRWAIFGVVLLVVVLLVGAAGTWYLFLRPSGPAPVSLGTTAPATAAPVAGGGGATANPGASARATAAAPGGSAAAAAGLDGPWTTDPSVGSFSDFSSSFAGYRVKETLANVGATEAVGRTPDITGGIAIVGTTIPTAEFEVDLTTLQSDSRMRDGQLNRQALETASFPKATFALSQPIDLGSVPAEGATVDVTAVGDLTLHGVTKSVEIPLQARLSGSVITIAGSLPITFADFGMSKPQSMMVLSVEDHGVMEFQLQLTRGLG
jgi:polyisoprenoid-binding protein YceI